MTPQDQITKMTAAIREAIKVMSDRFGSTEQDVATAIQELKISMQKEDVNAVKAPSALGKRAEINPMIKMTEITLGI